MGRIAEADMADVPRFLNRCVSKYAPLLLWLPGVCIAEAGMADVPRLLNRCDAVLQTGLPPALVCPLRCRAARAAWRALPEPIGCWLLSWCFRGADMQTRLHLAGCWGSTQRRRASCSTSIPPL